MNVNGVNGLMKLTKNKMYVIEWRDHFSTEGWFDINKPQITSDFTLRSVGFFMASDKNYYHFARTIGDHAYADMMSILRNQIIELIEIEEE